MLTWETETEVLENNTYQVGVEQDNYLGAGKAIAEVEEYKEE